MDIANDVDLADYSTMGLGGKARHLVKINSTSQLDQALSWADDKNLPVIMIGGGSNIVWRDEGFSGLVIVNDIKSFDIKDQGDGNYQLEIGAGENWDSVVERACKIELSGIEGLSLIPGLAGATPVQNVGAYGQEISEVLETLHAYDNKEKKYVDLGPDDCKFSYRNSRFKAEPNRFFITSLVLTLTKTKMKPPFYPALESYLNEHHISDYSPMSIRQAIINIRKSKLPDPAVVKNCGSFFGNPIISAEQLSELQSKYPDIPFWDAGEGKAKVHAAWLMDKAGFNNFNDQATGISTWPKQTLILVNKSAKSTSDLIAFKDKVVDKIKQQFNIELTQEPILLP